MLQLFCFFNFQKVCYFEPSHRSILLARNYDRKCGYTSYMWQVKGEMCTLAYSVISFQECRQISPSTALDPLSIFVTIIIYHDNNITSKYMKKLCMRSLSRNRINCNKNTLLPNNLCSSVYIKTRGNIRHVHSSIIYKCNGHINWTELIWSLDSVKMNKWNV